MCNKIISSPTRRVFTTFIIIWRLQGIEVYISLVKRSLFFCQVTCGVLALLINYIFEYFVGK